jgi:hypothetical protein
MIKFYFFKCLFFSLLRAEGFSCSLDTNKLQFFIKRIFQMYFFPSVFGHQNPGSRSDLHSDPDSLEMRDRDPQL